MENASKALIIAGAILIAILLISVGIMVMNSMNKPIDEIGTEADSQKAQMFNAKFTSYAGKDKSASQIRLLLGEAIASKTTEKTKFANVILCTKTYNNAKRVYCNDKDVLPEGYTPPGEFATVEIKDSALSSMKSVLFDRCKYSVAFKYKDGYINLIEIVEQ